MPRFFRRLAEGVFDLDDLLFRAGELADFVATAAATYHFDPTNVIAVGYSNGANTCRRRPAPAAADVRRGRADPPVGAVRPRADPGSHRQADPDRRRPR